MTVPTPDPMDGGLQALLRPRGIALLGISGRSENLMSRPLRYLVEHGYEGGVYPVNPNYEELVGRRCYPALADVPGPVDLVLVLVAADRVEDAIRQAAAVGARAAVVYASGFAEVGPEGVALQQRLAAVARETGVRVVGPNCQGFLYAPTGVVATFTAAADRPLTSGSGVAYVGQSGAVGGSVLDLATDMGLGLAAWFSTGNQADLDLTEVSLHLLADPTVRVLMLYVEATGNGAAYAELARRAQLAGKSLVVLRSGRSSAGRRAVASHTGSMLGDDVAFVLTSRRYGVVLVDDIDELLAVAAVLAAGKPAEGPRVAVVTTSGGAGSLAADQCEDVGLQMPELSAATQARLRPLIPPFGALANPVDVTAQLFNQGAHAFGDVCRIIAEDDAVDVVAVLVTMVVGDAGARLAEDLVATAAKLRCPLLVGWIAGQELTVEGRRVFREAGVPVFGSVGDLARVAARLAPPRHRGTPPPLPAVPDVPAAEVRALLEGPVVDGAALLRSIGIGQPASTLVTSPEAAREAVAALPGRGVLKLAAADLAHKSEVGGVRVGVGPDEAAGVFAELLDAARRHHVPGVEGVHVQELVPPGTELILAVTAGRDGFPPVVTVGLGGVTTELYRDLASALAPVSPEEAWAMLRGLRAWPLLAGFRGAEPADVPAAVDAVVRLSQAAVAAGDRLAEFEVNPLIVAPRGRGATAVDVLVRTTGSREPVGE
ncbi:acetate--CoA ligase family protein [Geodermatophilus obscurus]|uniref:CoA-binding domain protein n=1 Tax=Geodermatophilus obscurus (strain ATCC 25078 / DSM 43160 / JCM 3152 / CCUG 61914 / KCC A-0152 / KCTC 9177 / NBRC 13315 / NRRL B-3577 / G-20) TaxID=526225 RepID=D2SD02_GEOOG|nr:acetate--CoA ligase family protein [Geodermatophilus obscurus]ADB76351.1 CoA-binding domain protein [Geodermatophilus obscurus DSM 43160]